jgi:hypothetical protein
MGFLFYNIMEIWKTIIGFEDYQISNYGRVKSLERITKNGFNSNRVVKERILKTSFNTSGYYIISIKDSKGKQKTRTVHQLVSIAFLNHTPSGMNFVINHKDFNRLNNHIDNLEVVTQRENANKKHIKSISKYTGVSWYSNNNKWGARITINFKCKFLGLFNSEIEASKAYELALNKIKL